MCLEALGGNLTLASHATGIPRSSLARWARRQGPQARRAGPARAREQDGAEAATVARLRQAETRLAQIRREQASPASDTPVGPYARLERLALEDMLQEASRLAASLGEAIEDAPLGQRATALNQLLDKIMKVLSLLPRKGAAQEEVRVRVEFQDADASLHPTPYWTRAHSDE